MRIAVMGSGGVGGYFGARFALAGLDVRFVARGAHLAAIRENGLLVSAEEDVIMLFPALTITRKIAERGLDIFEKSLYPT